MYCDILQLINGIGDDAIKREFKLNHIIEDSMKCLLLRHFFIYGEFVSVCVAGGEGILYMMVPDYRLLVIDDDYS